MKLVKASGDSDRVDQIGLEGALVYGPLSVQAEYMTATPDVMGTDHPTFSAYYVMGSYFLTGESRPLQRRRLRPSETETQVRPEEGHYGGRRSGGPAYPEPVSAMAISMAAWSALDAGPELVPQQQCPA